MKKGFRAIAGVTLLEIMLVLAIAAMIIVMSIRYYQSTSVSQQANAMVEQVAAIVSASQNIAQTAGGYATVTNATVGPLLPASALTTPWGGTVTVTGAATTLTIAVSSTPPAVCTLVRARLQLDNHYTAPACGAAAATMTITYNATA